MFVCNLCQNSLVKSPLVNVFQNLRKNAAFKVHILFQQTQLLKGPSVLAQIKHKPSLAEMV